MTKKTTNLFELATRSKFAFPTPRGTVTVQELWDLPLQARDGNPSLDDTAKKIDAEIKATQTSFVEKKVKPSDLNDKLEVVKYIIATKLTEAEEAKTKATARQEAAAIRDALAERQGAALKSTSTKALQARLAALEAEAAE